MAQNMRSTCSPRQTCPTIWETKIGVDDTNDNDDNTDNADHADNNTNNTEKTDNTATR